MNKWRRPTEMLPTLPTSLRISGVVAGQPVTRLGGILTPGATPKRSISGTKSTRTRTGSDGVCGRASIRWLDFANPAKSPRLVGRAFRRPPYTVPFVCYFHPEELLSPSWMFGSKHVARNLASVLEACAAQGLRSRFVVASELSGEA